MSSVRIPRTYVVDGNGKVCAAFSDSPIADYETLDKVLDGLVGDDNVSLSLRLKVPTRASDNDFYFYNEYAVTYLQLWFFDSETKKFSAKVELRDLKPVEGSNTQYDITYLFHEIMFKAGVYDIFAIANYFIGPDEVDNEEELLNLVDSVTYVAGIGANISDRGPVMTNRATDHLGVDLIPYINKEFVLSIDIERVLAKLQIGHPLEGLEHGRFRVFHKPHVVNVLQSPREIACAHQHHRPGRRQGDVVWPKPLQRRQDGLGGPEAVAANRNHRDVEQQPRFMRFQLEH